MMIQLKRCPYCKNPVDYETLYSGVCLVCDNQIRTDKKQKYDWTITLEVSSE